MLLELTDAGRRVVETEYPRRVTREMRMLDGLSDDELDTLTDL